MRKISLQVLNFKTLWDYLWKLLKYLIQVYKPEPSGPNILFMLPQHCDLPLSEHLSLDWNHLSNHLDSPPSLGDGIMLHHSCFFNTYQSARIIKCFAFCFCLYSNTTNSYLIAPQPFLPFSYCLSMHLWSRFLLLKNLHLPFLLRWRPNAIR